MAAGRAIMAIAVNMQGERERAFALLEGAEEMSRHIHRNQKTSKGGMWVWNLTAELLIAEARWVVGEPPSTAPSRSTVTP